LEAEEGAPATYFLIPYKGRSGERVPGHYPSRRAAAYDLSDASHHVDILLQHQCEIGIHGLDGWHSPERGEEEMRRVTSMTGETTAGVRMHWLLRDANTPLVLEQAGYSYDATCGYNETIGYRAGTAQVFRPLGAQKILELPLHIQDGALFYRQRLDLSESQAEQHCKPLLENASTYGGVVTVLWHDRSHAPERFWGGFYKNLLRLLRSHRAWFATAMQIVKWFSKRRAVRFNDVAGNDLSEIKLQYAGDKITPPLNIRIYKPPAAPDSSFASAVVTDIPWNGENEVERLNEIMTEAQGFALRTFVQSKTLN